MFNEYTSEAAVIAAANEKEKEAQQLRREYVEEWWAIEKFEDYMVEKLTAMVLANMK